MGRTGARLAGAILLFAAAAGLGWLIYAKLGEETQTPGGARGGGPAPVEVGPVTHGPITLRRTFSGTLEPRASFLVAAKVGGRVERLAVDLADPVKRGMTLAWLDDDEYLQAVAQAEADLAVAQANLGQAASSLEIASRGLKRFETLKDRGVASDSQLDAARAEQLSAESALEVAKSERTRAMASLETARIRLGYTQVTADWTGGDDTRIVGERYVDEGETVAANKPLLQILELDPVTGVIFVPERDYSRLRVGQEVTLITDAWPGEEFPGEIERISPVFRAATRQAGVELKVPNDPQRLKPGMFVRVTVTLEHREDATIVPSSAMTKRGDRLGVFVVNEDSKTVRWVEVEVGLKEDDRVEVRAEGLAGRVVTLGQQLVEDGSAITIPGDVVTEEAAR